MTKLLSSVGVAIAVAAAFFLAGCNLYFGSSNSEPNGSNGGTDRPPGYSCDNNAQCAEGCFCSNGVCTEAGFCGQDKDCGTGFHCDTSRSSCIPNPQCSSNAQCAAGSTCDTGSGACVTTCACASDADAVAHGFGWCDEARGTCMTGKDPAGACLGDVTCTTQEPVCPQGQVALIKDGCFTGQCRAITVCEAPPVCEALQYEGDCTARTADCHETLTGHNCTGTGCGTPGGTCTCTSYTFESCATGVEAPTVNPGA